MFDTGNAIMMTSGAYAMTSTPLRTGGEEREVSAMFLLKFVKSLPFDAYMMMILLAALGVKIPICRLHVDARRAGERVCRDADDRHDV